MTVHADARLALVLLRAMTEALKVVNSAKRGARFLRHGIPRTLRLPNHKP